MDMDLGRTLILVGGLIVVVGVVLTLTGGAGILGHLPGDLTARGEGWTLYAPIATSIVLSIVLTLALNLFAWLARR